jgi:carbon-monoxide dehydrogenase medium subunit
MTTFVEPTTLEEACRLLDDDANSPKLVSGGTALVLMMRQGLIAPTSLVSLGAVPGLSSIDEDDDRIVIGARSTLTQVAHDDLVRRHIPALAEACRVVGNVRVRNVATIGGNIAEADYASDPPSVLIAMDATCSIQGVSKLRSATVQELITGFYSNSLEPDEVITAVTVSKAGPGSRSCYLKYVSRSSEDRPCVGVAVVADFEDDAVRKLSVVVGAVADIPQRRDDITSVAIGRSLEPAIREGIAESYAEAIDPMDDARGSAWYRRRMIRVFVRRALERVATA